MEVRAKLKRLRMSPKKIRLVIDVIRGEDVEKAQHQLQFLTKAAARPLLKLLNSAIANAENNLKLDKNNLFIKKIVANEGPVLKRYQPRAYGRAAEIRKPSTHIDIILAEKKEVKQKIKQIPSDKESTKAKIKEKRKREDLKIVKTEEIKKGIPDTKQREIPKTKDQRKPINRLREIKDKFFHRTGEK